MLPKLVVVLAILSALPISFAEPRRFHLDGSTDSVAAQAATSRQLTMSKTPAIMDNLPFDIDLFHSHEKTIVPDKDVNQLSVLTGEAQYYSCFLKSLNSKDLSVN